MINFYRPSADRQNRASQLLLLALLCFGPSVAAQEPAPSSDAEIGQLRARLEERWRIVPLRDGVLLVPRRASTVLKGLEVSGGELSIDGVPVPHDELASRIGSDAEAVLLLARVDAADVRRVFGAATAPAAADDHPVEPVGPAAAPAPGPAEDATGAPVQPSGGPSSDTDWGDRGRYDRGGHDRGARIRVGGDVIVREGERAGDVIAVLGSAEVHGTTSGDVVAVFGDVRLEPGAVVSGNVVTVGGVLHVAEGARVFGDVTEVRLWPSDVRVAWPEGRVAVSVSPDWPRIARFIGLSGVIGAGVLLVLGLLVAAIAPRAADSALVASRSVVRSWLAGLAVQVLFLPALGVIAMALAVSVVGIPLLAALPLLVLAVGVAALVGFTGVVSGLGSTLLGGQYRGRTTVIGYAIGLAIVLSVGLAGRYIWVASGGYSTWAVVLIALGCLVEHTAWTIGIGAALRGWLAQRNARRQAVMLTPATPPVPADV